MKLFRTILAAMLILCMLLPLASCGDSEPLPEVTAETETATKEEQSFGGASAVEQSPMPMEEYSIKDLEDSMKILGERTGFNAAGELMAEWCGSGFELNVNVGEEGSDLRIGFRCNYSARWKVYVDGEQFGERVTTGNGNKKQIVARAIPAGQHTIAFVKDSQPATNRNNYNSILSVAFNGELAEPAGDKELYLEFIGDGYLTGFGNLGSKAGVVTSKIIDESSFTASLPYLTAKALDADYSVVAHSQIGLSTKAGAFNLGQLYKNQYAYRELTETYKPTRKPDAIVIHAGMDDTISSLTQGKFIEAAASFTKQVRDYYKDQSIPVIWLYNTLYHTVRSGELKVLRDYMGPDSNVYALELSYGAHGAGTTETDRYPNAEEHQKSVDILVPYLKQLLGK